MVQVSSYTTFQPVKPTKSSSAKCWLLVLVMTIFAFWKEQPLVTTLNASHVTTKAATATKTTTIIAPSSPSASSKNPVVHREVIASVDVLWTVPIRTIYHEDKTPCGILFVAHGCSHSHTDWFVESEDLCKDCIGLPEERAIVAMALEQNLVVVAISSENRQSKCWNGAEDGPRVAAVLKELSARFDGKKSMPVPIFAFGASSGGAFVSQLGKFIKLDGFLSQIMARHPPVSNRCAVYLTMNRDVATDKAAKEFVAQAAASTTTASKAKQIRLPPLPISKYFFSDRILEMTKEQSASVFDSLQSAGWLDENNWLRHDPRRRDWKPIVRPHVPETLDSLLADLSPMSEVMNVAYGKHELTRDGVKDALQFCLLLQDGKSSTCNSV